MGETAVDVAKVRLRSRTPRTHDRAVPKRQPARSNSSGPRAPECPSTTAASPAAAPSGVTRSRAPEYGGPLRAGPRRSPDDTYRTSRTSLCSDLRASWHQESFRLGSPQPGSLQIGNRLEAGDHSSGEQREEPISRLTHLAQVLPRNAQEDPSLRLDVVLTELLDENILLGLVLETAVKLHSNAEPGPAQVDEALTARVSTRCWRAGSGSPRTKTIQRSTLSPGRTAQGLAAASTARACTIPLRPRYRDASPSQYALASFSLPLQDSRFHGSGRQYWRRAESAIDKALNGGSSQAQSKAVRSA